VIQTYKQRPPMTSSSTGRSRLGREKHSPWPESDDSRGQVRRVTLRLRSRRRWSWSARGGRQQLRVRVKARWKDQSGTDRSRARSGSTVPRTRISSQSHREGSIDDLFIEPPQADIGLSLPERERQPRTACSTGAQTKNRTATATAPRGAAAAAAASPRRVRIRSAAEAMPNSAAGAGKRVDVGGRGAEKVLQDFIAPCYVLRGSSLHYSHRRAGSHHRRACPATVSRSLSRPGWRCPITNIL
jgi:hypothetical protein